MLCFVLSLSIQTPTFLQSQITKISSEGYFVELRDSLVIGLLIQK